MKNLVCFNVGRSFKNRNKIFLVLALLIAFSFCNCVSSDFSAYASDEHVTISEVVESGDYKDGLIAIKIEDGSILSLSYIPDSAEIDLSNNDSKKSDGEKTAVIALVVSIAALCINTVFSYLGNRLNYQEYRHKVTPALEIELSFSDGIQANLVNHGDGIAKITGIESANIDLDKKETQKYSTLYAMIDDLVKKCNNKAFNKALFIDYCDGTIPEALKESPIYIRSGDSLELLKIDYVAEDAENAEDAMTVDVFMDTLINLLKGINVKVKYSDIFDSQKSSVSLPTLSNMQGYQYYLTYVRK